MRIRTLIAAQTALLLLAAPLHRATAGTTAFTPTPGAGMKVRIEGTSTVHDWQVEGKLIAGMLETGANFPTEPGQAVTVGKAEAKAAIRIPVTSLKSVEKDGSPYSDKMNEIMYGKLKSSSNAFIIFLLTDLSVKEVAKDKDSPYVLDAKGDLIVAGVTNKVAFPINVLPLAEHKLKISGNTSLKMTDFKVEPPMLIGILSTGDPVKISFEWPLKQRAAATAAAK